jgi:drug/metabolite transporter (DMT)-like permease
MQKYKPYLAGLGYASIFGFSFIFTRGALDHVAPYHLLGLRFAAAFLFLNLLKLLGLVRVKVTPAHIKALLPLAFFQPLLYFSAETFGVQLTSSSHAGMMIAVIPIFVTILAAIILKERPRPTQIPFILASVGGVMLIMAMQKQNGSGSSFLGSILLIVAVLAAACYNIASRRASARFAPIQITWVMMLVGAVAFNLIALGQCAAAGSLTLYFEPLPLVWPAVAYLGILSSVTAFFLNNFALSKLPAAQSAVFSNLVTVIAVTAGVLFRNEPFYWYHAAGAAAILVGVWGTNWFAHSGRQENARAERNLPA